jgi:hypothetical protein
MSDYREHLPEGFKGRALIRGDLLPDRLQRDALAAYLHRFTRDHKPLWARKPRDNGAAYPVQFASDREWLSRSLFPVTVRKGGALGDHCRGHGQSYPTWPDGLAPEDRDKVPGVAETVPAFLEGSF